MESYKSFLNLKLRNPLEVTLKELNAIQEALIDFLGGTPFSLEVLFKNDSNPKIIKIPSNLVIQKITYNEDKWSDPFFKLLSSKINSEKLEILKEAGKRGKILMVRLAKTESQFTKEVKAHSEIFHKGFVPYSELIFTGYYNGDSLSSSIIDKEEKKHLEEIKRIASNAIKFYALEEDEKLKDVISEINKESDKYELIYEVYLALNDLNKSNNQISFISILSGVAGLPILEEISKNWGDFASQVTSQMAGEIISMITLAGDRIAEQLSSLTKKEKTIKSYFGLVGQSLKNLPSQLKSLVISQAREFSNTRQKILQRLFVLGLTTTVAITLSAASQYTDSLTPYGLIPIMNSSLIAAYEIIERSKNVKPISNEEFKQLIKKIPKPLRNLFRKLPPTYTVAYLDFALNNYALGSYIGSLLATLSVLTLQNFEISKEMIYVISGMITEPLTAIAYGKIKEDDPYEKFCRNLTS